MDPSVIIAVVAALGSAGAAYFASRSQRQQTVATVKSEAQTRADARLDAAIDGERGSWKRTEERMTRENTALSTRIDVLERMVRDLSDKAAQSSGRVEQLTRAMVQAGLPVPEPRDRP